jgi:hypothetical protein
MQKIVDRIGIRNSLIAILSLGFGLRLIAAKVTHGHGFDLHILGDWGWKLQFRRLDEFYYVAKNPDHLPGDLWFHWVLGTVFRSFGGTHYWGDTYYFLLRVVPSIADVLIALLIFDIVRNLVSPKSGLIAASVFFLNPATAFVSSVWGQWDSVSMVLLLAGLLVVVRRPDHWIWSVPFIAWATVVKPPLALPGLLIIAMPMLIVLRDSEYVAQAARRIVPSILGCAALGLTMIALLCMPFNIGFPGMATNWTMFERAQIALDLYPFKVLAAGNIWMLPQGSFDQIDDRHDAFLGISSHGLGNLYLFIAVLGIAAAFIYLLFTKMREQPYLALGWAITAITFATYMLPTRVHERYLFPTFASLIILNGMLRLGRKGLLFLALFSATFLANLSFVYYGFNNDDFIADYGAGTVAFLLRTTSVINILAFIVILILPWYWHRETPVSQPRNRSVGRVRDLPAH